MKQHNSLIARILAALALIAAVAVVLVVVSSETGGNTDESAVQNPPARQGNNGGQGNQRPASKQKVYEVQEGDTLNGIASEKGVSVDRIERLNPDLDPQALIPGQELKLR